jgi:hypothetical protein
VARILLKRFCRQLRPAQTTQRRMSNGNLGKI